MVTWDLSRAAADDETVSGFIHTVIATALALITAHEAGQVAFHTRDHPARVIRFDDQRIFIAPSHLFRLAVDPAVCGIADFEALGHVDYEHVDLRSGETSAAKNRCDGGDTRCEKTFAFQCAL
jgi:hypothetical protein